MKKGVIVIGHHLSLELARKVCDGAFVVGADKGARYCLENGIPMDAAVGDFDSLNEEEKAAVLKAAPRCEVLNPIKDDTDTSHALSLLQDCSEIVILGGIQGNRPEHFYANLDLLANDSRISLLDDSTQIRTYLPGIHEIQKNEYTFFSFFALEPSKISLNGFAYEIQNYSLGRYDPLGVSNQILGDAGVLKIDSGKILAFFSKKD